MTSANKSLWGKKFAIGIASSNSGFLNALQTFQVLHIWMNVQLMYEPIVLQHFQFFFSQRDLFADVMSVHLTHLSCSPNFRHASYLDKHTLTYEPIVNWNQSSSKPCLIMHLVALWTLIHLTISLLFLHFVPPSWKLLFKLSLVNLYINMDFLMKQE